MSAAARILPMPPAAAPAASPGLLVVSNVAHVLSPSQVAEYLDCSARWYYHHALGLPDKRTAALAIGEALHAVTAAALRIKARNQVAAWDQAEQLLRAHMAEGLQLCELDADEKPVDLAELAVRMLRVWWDQVYPQLETAAVEFRMTGSIGGVSVQGTADVITACAMLVDLKTASKKPAGISSSHALQLTTYAMLADQATAKVDPPKRHTTARLYTITKTKTPAVVQQTVEITAEDRAYAEYIYPAVQEAARRGEVLPRRSSNLCSRKHCAYWLECQADYGGYIRE